MLTNLAKLEAKVTSVINDKSVEKVYHFLCDQDSPLPAVRDALCKFLAYISQIEEKVKEQQEAAAKAEAEKSEVAPIEEKVEVNTELKD